MRYIFVLMLLILCGAQSAQAQSFNNEDMARRNRNSWRNGQGGLFGDSPSSIRSEDQRDLAKSNSIYNERRRNESSQRVLMAPASREGYFRKARD